MKFAVLPLAMTLLLACAAFAGEATATQLNDEGIKLIDEGSYAEAIQRFEKARALKPGDPVLLQNLAIARSRYGVSLLKAERTKDAIHQFRLAAALEPSLGLYHANLGIALTRAGNAVDGKKELEKAIGADRSCGPAYAELGTIAYRDGDLQGAIRNWEKAALLLPKRKDIAAALARAKQEQEIEKNQIHEDSAHFTISWDGDKDASVGARVLQMLEDAYQQVGSDLGIYPKGKTKVYLYTKKEFEEVTGAHEWIGGLFDGRIRIPVKNFESAEKEIRGTVFHEYTHVAVASVTHTCPAWLNEGLAQTYEGRSVAEADAVSKKALAAGDLFGLADLRASFTRFTDARSAGLAYSEGLSLTSYLSREFGPDRIARFLRALGEGENEGTAAEAAFNTSLDDLFKAWKATL